MSPRTLGIVVGLAVVAADQVTKAWALEALTGRTIPIVDGVFQLRLARNSGAAFSLFSGGGPLLGVVAIGVVALIVWSLKDGLHRVDAVALGLVLGGAGGNLADRVFRATGFLDGLVVDWLDIVSWPTFNLADAAITVGVVLLLARSFFDR